MKSFFSILIAFLSLSASTGFTQAPAAVTAVPCEAPFELWVEKAASVQPATRTCHLYIDTDTKNGDCAKSDSYQCRNQFTGEVEFCERCLSYKTVTWKKTVDLICGGQKLFNGVQSCSLKNSTVEKLNAYVGKYNHAVGSIFIESLSVQGYSLLSTDDARFFFEKR